MATPATLREYIAQLKQAPDVSPPPSDNRKEHVECISVPGRIAQVTEEDYYYWLEVLPPKWMSGSHFCFGEGYDPFRLFWMTHRDDRYWCRQLTDEETDTFCRLAGMPHPT
jgi:hypothetical protein